MQPKIEINDDRDYILAGYLYPDTYMFDINAKPEAIIRKVCREDMGIPDSLGFPFVRLGARLFGGFSIMDGGALEAVKHAKVPLMIMHGDEDDFVPFSMCHELYEAIPGQKTLLTVAGAGHGLSYFAETERYEQTLHAFESAALEQEDGKERQDG